MIFDVTDAVMGLLGGLMIGLSAALFLLVNGRIAGISGLIGGLLRRQGPWIENLVFLAALIAVPAAYAFAVGAPAIGVTTEVWVLVVGGLLVGAGTRLGNGCTSGHGVCGMTRLSTRSFAATLVFMAVGVLVATAIRPMLGIA